MKHSCFQAVFAPLKWFPRSQAEVRNLKSTVWKTPFRTLRRLGPSPRVRAPQRERESGREKAHKHKLFALVGFGTALGLSQGQTRFVTGTNPLSLGQTQVFSLFYTVEAQFVPGTHPVRPWDKPGVEGPEKVRVVKVYVLSALARERELRWAKS